MALLVPQLSTLRCRQEAVCRQCIRVVVLSVHILLQGVMTRSHRTATRTMAPVSRCHRYLHFMTACPRPRHEPVDSTHRPRALDAAESQDLARSRATKSLKTREKEKLAFLRRVSLRPGRCFVALRRRQRNGPPRCVRASHRRFRFRPTTSSSYSSISPLLPQENGGPEINSTEPPSRHSRSHSPFSPDKGERPSKRRKLTHGPSRPVLHPDGA